MSMDPVDKHLRQIVIDLRLCKLQLREAEQTLKVYPVAVGAKETPSPVGVYEITKKAHWGGPFGTRWMQLSVPWGTYGIHGTNRPGSIGQQVSHGCIRMHNRNVEELYAMVETGTPVTMEGTIVYRLSVNGSRGNLVEMIQARLHALGFYAGQCHSIFDEATEKAVIAWQRTEHLPVTGQVNQLGLASLAISLS